LAVESQSLIDSLLRDQIATLERNLNRRLDTTERNMGERLDRQDTQLQRIEGKVDKTNGRVTVLEKARERAQGVVSAYRWLPPTLAAIVTAGMTVLIMALSGGLH
jgi:hypothetical protein